jgi:glycosyltransferase involved in cell wall biosynthesis
MLNYAWGVLAGQSGEGVHIGGEEVQHALMSRYLARQGFAVSSLVGDFGQRAVESIDGVTVRKTFALRAGLPGLRFFTPRMSRTWAALRAADADVCYASCAGAVAGIAAAWCGRHRRRFVFRVASDADCAPHTLMLGNARDRALYRYGLRRADAVLVQTRHQATLLLRHYGVKARVAGMFADLPAGALPMAERATDLLWVANLRSMKRPLWFVDVARHARELRCVMAGGAHPDEPALYRGVARAAAAVPNLRFLGQVRFDSVGALFAQARVLVNTSSFEGFPNTFWQAWAHGVPVISTVDPDGVIVAHGLGVVLHDAAGVVGAAGARRGAMVPP